MKRITSFLLAIVLFAGLVLTGAPVTFAASEMGVSDALVEVLKKEEGFSEKPYWDYSQYTIGYGTRCPSDMVDYYKENGITKEAAETLLRNYLSGTESAINKKLIDKYDLKLTQGQFDALVSFTYNLGTSWLSDSSLTIHKAIRNGATGSELINAFALWCNAGGQILPGLVRRRLCEANMYLNEKYSNTQPDDYCYVYYNANGGSVSYRLQGYDADEGIAPKYTPTYEGHTFLGWYTAKTGGTKITKLTKSLNGDTLYARWDEEGKEETTAPTNDVSITVTGSGVNLRKGPGTNYSIVGTADKGDKFTVTETDKCDTYTWGKIGNSKWIALKYTNYEEAVKEQQPQETKPEETTAPTETTAPETTAPETTTPETTTPETTAPETTVPETTVPETTEPAPTESVDNTKVTGTVKASKLAVRKGPGSNYGVVKNIVKGTKVTITQRKTIDGIVWGKISSGWLSVRHVTLDKPAEETAPPATTEKTDTSESAAVTGKITASSLAVRKGAGTSYAVKKYLKNGTKVTITEQKDVKGTPWGKISDGWICMDYVTLDQKTSQEATSVKKTVTASCLNVRASASTSAKIVGYYYKNAKVTILETKKVGSTTWGKTSKGWISMDYVK